MAQQLDKVTKAQDDVSDSAKRASAASEQQRGALEQLYEARVREKKGLDDSAAALRGQSTAARQNADALRQQATQVRASADALRAQRDAAVRAQQASLAEASSLRDLARARAEQVGAIDKTAQQLTRQANAARKEADQNRLLASSYDKSISAIDNRARALERDATASERAARSADKLATTHERSSSRISRSIGNVVRDLGNLEGRTNDADAATSRFGRTLQRLGIQSDGTKSSLRGLNSEFQGFQLAIIIKYAQSLLSTLIALGAQLVAVAAAAGQAAAGLSAAFGAAAAQAIPVVGVLAAAFSRLTAVLKAVKLQNQQQLTDVHNTATSAKRQTAAADQIRNAQQQVADAHRNVARAVQDLARAEADAARQEVRAQNDVTQARKDAIRTVQDLIAAERDAQVQLLQTQASLRGSIQSGDVLGTLAAFDAQTAARQGATRAGQDAAPVRARGVEGVPAVQQAEQRLGDVRRTNTQQLASAERQVTDAQLASRRAEQNLASTRVQAAQNVGQETAAVDKLTNSIKLLSPAERRLYTDILALQATYKRVARPITDILTNAFGSVVGRVNKLLQDPRLLRGFHDIAVQISRSIKSGLGDATGPQSVGLFEQLQREAVRNIPTVTRVIRSLFDTVRNLVRDALPAFRELLRFVDGYAGSLRKAVATHPKQITDFFVAGVKSAESFFKLGLAVIRLLLTISGSGGAAHQGKRTIDDLTKSVDGLTEKANKNAGKIRKFFGQTHDALFQVISVLGTVGKALINAFNPGSVKTLASFLNDVIIPAVSSVVQFMGLLVNAFHAFLTLPGISQLAETAATFLLMAKGLDIIHHAVTSILEIFPNFLKSFGLLVPVVDEATGAVTGFELIAGGWIVIAIAAAVAAIILLNKHFHFLGPTFAWLKTAAKDVFDWLKTAAGDVVKWFEDVWNHGLLMWVRAPFIALAKIIGQSALFKGIINDARAVIGFFTSGKGAWGGLAPIMLLPFTLTKDAIKIVLDLIKGVVKIFIDVLAGRFGQAGRDIKQMFDGIIGTLAGAASTFLDIWGKMLGALGNIPGIGGPFKAAAKFIDGARDSIDKWRDSLGKSNDAQNKSDDQVKKSLPNLVKLHDRYQAAEDRLSKLTPGTRDYRTAVKNAADASLDYNVALKDTAAKADNARPSVKTLKDNIDQLGGVSADTAKAIAQNLNDVLKQVGAKTIKLNTAAYKRANIDEVTNVTGHAATGGVLSRALGLRRRLYGGGIANPYGGAADDHILYSPMGSPVAALSGTEGIINRPQMGAIDHALGFANAMGATPWGSLNDLWGSGMRHFQGGGKLQLPTNFTATHQTAGLQGYPAVDVLGTPGEQVGSPIGGQVVKLSGRPPSAGAYRGPGGPFGWSEYISGGGRTYYLTHFGSRSVSLGQRVRRGQTLGTVGDYPGTVPDHIHEGLHGAGMSVTGSGGPASAMQAAVERILAPKIRGDTNNAIGRIALASARRLARAANRYVGRQTGTSPSGDFTGDPGTATGNGANLMRSISRRLGWNFNDWWNIDARETGHGTNETNPTSTARLRGQFLSSNWGKYGPGSDPRLNPSMSQQIKSMAAYIAQRYRNPTSAWDHEKSFGWYKRGGPLRRMQTGGPIKGVARLGPLKGVARPGRITTNNAPPLAATLARALGPINTLMDGVSTTLEAVARGPLQRSKHLANRIAGAFDKLTGDSGLLSKLSDAVDAISTHAATALQRRQFVVGRNGPRRIYQTPAQLAQDQLQTLRSTRTGLVDEQTTISSSLADAQNALVVAQRHNNKRAEAAARAAIKNLKARQEKVTQDLAQNAQDQVETQESFQQALATSVDTAASRQSSAIDRWQRMAAAVGTPLDPNDVLRAQNTNISNQVGGLQGVLSQALASGNMDLATQLSDQIADLNVQMAENTKAIKDNTEAAFNTATQNINDRQSFAQTVFSGAQGFFQAFSQRTGTDTTQQQSAALQGVGSSLTTQQTGLKGQLASLLGYTPQETAQLAQLSGGGLVNYIESIASGPAFDAIMSRLDPTQQASFKDLISSLIGNATATEQNTQALQDLTGNNAQSFSSSFWTNFRTAIFTGTGALLPQYAMTIPGADVGARVQQSGALMVHAGETVRPASVSRDWGKASSDTFNLNVTTPTEVLNPVDVNRQLSFLRRTSGR